MKNIFTIFVVSIFSLMVFGCAPLISPDTLKKSSATQSIRIEKDLIYFFPGETMQSGLFAGNYVPELEDKDGIFYRGPSACFLQRSTKIPGLNSNFDGGIWVAKEPGKTKVKLYQYVGTQVRVDSAGKTTDALPRDPNLPLGTVPLAPIPNVSGGAQVVGGVLGSALLLGIAQAGIKHENGKIIFSRYSPGNVDIVDFVLQTNGDVKIDPDPVW